MAQAQVKNKKFRFAFKKQFFAAPFLVFMLMFVVFPLLIILYYSFFDDGSFTFSSFAFFFSDSLYVITLLQSVGVALATMAICLLIGYPVAYILSMTKFKKAPIILTLFILPMWINSLLRTVAVRELVYAFFDLIGVQGSMSMWTLMFGLVLDFLPFMILPIYTVLNNMDKSYVEASLDLGASPAKTFFKTVVPLSVPGIMSGMLMVFTPVVSTYFMNELLGPGSGFSMFGQIINDFMQTESTYSLGSAFSLILLVLVALSVAVTNRFSKMGNERGGLW